MSNPQRKCTHCGIEANLTIVDDETRVCDKCLDSLFFKCDVCGEYWDDSYVEQHWLKDGRSVCEYCAEDFDEEDLEVFE